MRIVGIFALTVGAAMLVGVLPLFIYESRPPREAEAYIEAGQDSLAYTAAGADSVAIDEHILEGWWRPTGPGGTLLIAGAVLMVLGWYTLQRAVNAPWNLPPLDERYRDHG